MELEGAEEELEAESLTREKRAVRKSRFKVRCFQKRALRKRVIRIQYRCKGEYRMVKKLYHVVIRICMKTER